jgi:hypothetical protein
MKLKIGIKKDTNNETVVEKSSDRPKCWCCGSTDLNWAVMYSVWCRRCGAVMRDLD